jgi:predicted MPP superfamily phosphohydrolase
MTSRRKFVFSLLGASASAAAYPCYVEPRWLEVTHRRVRLHGAGGGKPVRLLHLSDLHASFVVPMSMIDHAITLGLAEKPDVICVTGDFITGREGFDPGAYIRALRRLSAFAPTFAVLGNHDGGRWARTHLGFADHRNVEQILDASGMELLHNRSVQFQRDGRTLRFVGVGDLWTDEIRAGRAFSGVGSSEPTIVLAHNPDSKDDLASCPWDLMLSGHTHGGQIRLYDGSRYAPVHDKRYVSGLKPWGARQIHVSRGVGNIASVRFRCRPEATLLLVG